ncbi:DNA methyltransferase [Phaeodactylibacter xiamenensis]|uniref:DNA methyltransferase n=1 Tax=Phaeodactylibacter xiamenensis TaxID=1524460 RepID=UPI003CCB8F1A
MDKEKIKNFIEYAQKLDGDEKGEAQVFCDRLFQAFGHKGYKEAGAILEKRVKSKKSTRFADLLWGDRVVIEMKKRGAKLESHRTQVFDYWWNLRPNQPKYSVLCNFDEFYIYDFSKQDEPLDRIKLEKLESRITAFNFLYPKSKEPIFENNLEEVTRKTAAQVVKVFNSLVDRGEKREDAQKFTLQSIFTMFAEDHGLLPDGFFTSLIMECLHNELSSYDLIGGLFKQMANPTKARGGRFKEIPYFNGGLFNEIAPLELNRQELFDLLEASKRNWSKVNPAIFGTIFQSSMGKDERHAYGAHFTNELDIYKIVHPTIIEPWMRKIKKANSLDQLKALLKEIREFLVLDPACGSGNFLYIAYRELKRLEMEIINRIHLEYTTGAKQIGTTSLVSLKQFYGIDLNEFAVELAKVTMLLAKEIAIKETQNWLSNSQMGMDFELEEVLPLDNLDTNIVYGDALFVDWIEADVIIGNPPYQSKNKMQEELGGEYLNKLWNAYPDIPGRADFCVYWFYKAHKTMKEGAMAGLVGTNTIRQNYSREGSLDYIVKNKGQIFNAVSSQDWSGDAVVFVSIVCWSKGEYNGTKKLYTEDNKGGFIEKILDSINSSLSVDIDLTKAKIINANKKPKVVFQGQTHGHSGFLLKAKDGYELSTKGTNQNVVKPFLIAQELVGDVNAQPKRFVIDFSGCDLYEARSYEAPFHIVSTEVLPDREAKAKKQERKNKELLEANQKARINKHHINFYNNWWKLSYGREDMIKAISKIKRYIAAARVSKRQIFEFVTSGINPNDALIVFAFEDDYSFGVINSIHHWEWWKAKCSTLKGDYRYTTNTVWDTFPFPQNPSIEQVREVAKASRALRDKRNEVMKSYSYSLREVYRLVEQHGKDPIKDLHIELDEAVRNAYGFEKKKDILQQLLDLNFEVAKKEKNGEKVQAPGLPGCIKDKSEFITDDCIKFIHDS